MRAFLVAAILVAWSAAPALAWNRAGHEIIAMLAYDQLAPEAKAKVDAILKHHPRVREDLLGDDAPPTARPDASTSQQAATTEAAEARDAFIAVAAWPDEIRAGDHPMHKFHRPQWHYIDIPYVLGNAAPGAAADATAGPPNAVEALNQCLTELNDPATEPGARAIALCWVIHLVGDLHQPLHACDLVSPQFPEGDRGGNSFIVLTNPARRGSQVNLHWLWDSMLGDYQSKLLMGMVADGIRRRDEWSRSALQEELAKKSVADWAAESHAVAVQSVYLNGKLKGTSAAVLKKDGSAAIPALPPGYRATGERVAARQAALAGYRLADLLNGMRGKQ